MKITFWSPMPGQSGNSSNLLAVSIMNVLRLRKKHLLLQLGLSTNSLDLYLKKEISELTNSRESGMDALIRSIRSGKAGSKTLYDCSSMIWKNELDFLSGTQSRNNEIFEKELEEALPRILALAEENYDYIYIDAGGIYDGILSYIIRETDILVVSLSQNPKVISRYQEFLSNSSIADSLQNSENTKQKVFYLVGRYDPNSIMSEQNIRLHNTHFSRNNIGILPYHTEYHDAMISSKTASFLVNNETCPKNDKNFYFINEVRKTAEKIGKHIFSAIKESNRQEGDKNDL